MTNDGKIQVRPMARLRHTSRTGSIRGYALEELIDAIGFEPNTIDEPDRYEWSFRLRGAPAMIWSHKGSHKLGDWSTYGSHKLLEAMFGPAYSCERF